MFNFDTVLNGYSFFTETILALFSFDTVLNGYSFFIGIILPFLFVLSVVVFVHEMGHYSIGRLCGIGVEKFSVGFGRELVGFNDRRGTRWSLSLIPLGGYVKFLGDMDPTGIKNEVGLNEEQKKQAFFSQVAWKKILTVFAGPFFNFLLSIAILSVLFYSQGKMVIKPVAEKIQANSPAAQAGFQAGDRFISINGTPISEFSDVQRLIAKNPHEEILFKVLRKTEVIELKIRPELREHTDSLGNKTRSFAIGVISDGTLEPRLNLQYGIKESFLEAIKETYSLIVQTGFFLKNLVSGNEDHCKLGGPIKIADMAGKAAKTGIEHVFYLIALLSTGIGVLNLFPLPPLDGGHIVVYSIEGLIRRPIPKFFIEKFYQLGFLLIILLMGFVFWNDISGC